MDCFYRFTFKYVLLGRETLCFENESIFSCLFLYRLCSFQAESAAGGVEIVHCRDRLQKK